MTMNLDIVKNVYAKTSSNTRWEDFIHQLEKGLSLIEHAEDLHKRPLDEMRAANIALTYNRELMLYSLMS